MTPAQAGALPPTKRQLWYLGLLASKKRTTFPEPATFDEAARRISELEQLPPFRNQFLPR